jgi:hypothetical protein
VRPRTHAGVFAGALALVAVFTWPLVTDLGRLLPSGMDPRLFSWVLLTVFRNLVTQPALLFHGNAFYPVGNTLALAEPLLVPALLAGPVFWLTDNPVLAYNVALLVFWAFSGWAAYAVGYALTQHHPAAFVGAMIFTFAPYRMDHYREFQMEMAFGIPLAVFLLVRFLETQRPPYLAAFLAVFWLQAASVWYYAIILSLGLAALVLQVLALRWTGWRLRTLGLAAAGAVVLAAALYPIARPYFLTRRELGYARGLPDAVRRSADVLSYVEARANWLYEAFTVEREWEASLFRGVAGLALAGLGLAWLAGGRAGARSRLERGLAAGLWLALVLGLAALLGRGRLSVGAVEVPLSFTGIGVALLLLGLARHAAEGWRRWRAGVTDRALDERDWVRLLLGLAAFAFLLSLGPVVAVGGEPIGEGLYARLWPYLLPLHAIRGPTRIGILFILAGALLAALGVKWLAVHRPPLVARAIVGGLVALLALEYAWMPLPYERIPAVARPVDEVLRQTPPGSVVLEWPTNVRGTDADAMFRSLVHGRRIVNGLSGFVPDLIRDISGLLTTAGPSFPVPEAQAALRQIYPLRYLVVRRTDPAVTAEWRLVWERLPEAAPPLLRHLGRFGSEDLYELEPLPERGGSVERWVSYDFLRGHPRLVVTLRPLVRRPDLEQWVEVQLNGRAIARLPLQDEAHATVPMRPPLFVAAPNVIRLVHRYGRPEAVRDGRYRIGATGRVSPGDLEVESRGQPHGSRASIRYNGVELARDRRGYNLVALDSGGQVLDAALFDTFARADAAPRLQAWVEALPAGVIVAGAVRDEGSGQLTEGAVRALGTLGVAGDLRGRYREAHAFVGVKGAAPGTALEALGPRPIELVVGRVEGELGFELAAFALEAAPAGSR